MKKKIIIVSILCVLCIGLISGILFLDNKNVVLENEKTKKSKNNNQISMMLETAKDSNVYEVSSDNTFPISEYIFNETLSKCENGGSGGAGGAAGAHYSGNSSHGRSYGGDGGNGGNGKGGNSGSINVTSTGKYIFNSKTIGLYGNAVAGSAGSGGTGDVRGSAGTAGSATNGISGSDNS